MVHGMETSSSRLPWLGRTAVTIPAGCGDGEVVRLLLLQMAGRVVRRRAARFPVNKG